MHTLCIDIGGTGIKAIVVDAHGQPLTDRRRIKTPRPAVPDAVLEVIDQLVGQLTGFDRVSVGVPGVVIDGIARTAPNLDGCWEGFLIADAVKQRTGKPVRVANDAGIQGMAVIEGRGLEMVLTLGTGFGCGLYIDGRYVPNLELAHHPFRKGETYEDRVGDPTRKRIGTKRWNKRVRTVIAQIEPIFNYRRLYLGGGNARRLEQDKLPENVTVVDNLAGLLGGYRLWEPIKGSATEA